MTASIRLRQPRRVFVIGLAIVIAAIACNVPYEYKNTEQWLVSRRENFEVMRGRSDPPRIIMAGLPACYYVRTETNGHATSPNISWRAVAINGALWGLLSVAIIAYEWVAARRSTSSERKGRSLSLLDLLLLLVVVAAVMTYWRSLEARYAQTQDLVQRIRFVRGDAQTAVFLPRVVSSWLPKYVQRRFLAIYSASLENADYELLDELLNQSMLQQLRIGGGEVDSSVTQRIGQMPLLWDLRLAGVKLAPIDIQNLSNVADRLVALNLMRTNVTWAGIEALGPMPRLKHLGLSHTNCHLATLPRTAWSNRLEELMLPHPASGESDSLEMEDWPALRELRIVEFDEVKNSEPVTVSLRRMPALEEVALDPLQNFRVEISDLPQLRQLTFIDAQLEERARSSADVPSTVWLSGLQLHDVPHLEELDVFAEDLANYRIAGAHKLQLRLNNKYLPSTTRNSAVYSYSSFYNSRFGQQDSPSKHDAYHSRSQSWIDSLAECDGPLHVSFDSLPLQGCDLAPLARNEKLATLNLSRTGITSELSSLGSAHLSKLSLMDLMVPPEILAGLLERLPNLKRIEITEHNHTHLILKDKPQLQSIFFDGEARVLPNATTLELENLPQLRDVISIARSLETCVVRNVPRLRGLHLHAPLPDSRVIEGLKDLGEFSGGGVAIDDALFDKLLECKGLRSLNLSYAAVSTEKLRSVAEWPKLETLCLYGCQVDDSVAAEIAKLSNLKLLRLEQTSVTPEATRSLASLTHLHTLRISETPMAQGDFRQLLKLPKLQTVAIGGATLDQALAQSIGEMKVLQRLDLTGCTLTQEGVVQLATKQPQHLKELSLRDIQQPELSIRPLERLHTRFDIEDSVFEPNGMDQLLASGRTWNSRYVPLTLSLQQGVVTYSGSMRDVEFFPEVFGPTYANANRQATNRANPTMNMRMNYSGAVQRIPPPVGDSNIPLEGVQGGSWGELFYRLGFNVGAALAQRTAAKDRQPRANRGE